MENQNAPITLLVAQDEPRQVVGEPCDSVSERDTKPPQSDDSDTV